MIDRYTKAVLTAIAVALGALALQGFIPDANAAAGDACGTATFRPCFVAVVTKAGGAVDPCGTNDNPCYVRGGGRDYAGRTEPVNVRIIGQ